VKCPLGCWAFPDYCQMVQYHHFLAYHTGFNFPGSNAKLFNSARPDWPNPKRYKDCHRIFIILQFHFSK
jgi:hypothetical protein